MATKFIAEIIGEAFVLTMQGRGNTTAAKQTLENVFDECKIVVRSLGEPVDIDSGR